MNKLLKPCCWLKNYAQALLKNIQRNQRLQAQSHHERAQIIRAAEIGKTSAFKLVQDYIQSTHLFDGIADSAFRRSKLKIVFPPFGLCAFSLKRANGRQDALGNFEKLKQQRQKQNSHNAVQLISIHKSKRAGWPVVIIPGFNAHYYPYEAEGEFYHAQ